MYEEIENIDKYWEFIDFFIPKEKSVYDYNIRLRKNIKKKYSIEEFYYYEMILNKLLHHLLGKFKIQFEKINNESLVFNLNDINGHSYSNKLLLYHEKYKKLYYTKLKLSKIVLCLTNRKLYEECIKMTNLKDALKQIKIKLDTYYPLDYPFPNVNLLFYNDNKKETWIKNIKRLYYSKNWEENMRKNLYFNNI